MLRDVDSINPLTPNDHYSCRTAPLTSKRCILYIYSTNISTEYFKHGIYSSFHNYNGFSSCIIHVLYTGCAKIKKKTFRRQKVKTVNELSFGLEETTYTAVQRELRS